MYNWGVKCACSRPAAADTLCSANSDDSDEAEVWPEQLELVSPGSLLIIRLGLLLNVSSSICTNLSFGMDSCFVLCAEVLCCCEAEMLLLNLCSRLSRQVPRIFWSKLLMEAERSLETLMELAEDASVLLGCSGGFSLELFEGPGGTPHVCPVFSILEEL